MSGLSKNESSQAMQNLFSAYEDADESKAEVNISDDEEFSDYSETPTGSKSTEKSVEKTTGEKSDQDERQNLDEPEVKKPKLESRVTATRLVSYGPDDQDEGDDDDEEEDEKHIGDDDMFSQFKSPSNILMSNGTPMTTEELTDSLSKPLRHSLSEDDVQIPAEPPGKCSMRLQDKISKLYYQMQQTGRDLNANIQQRKEFRNPSIYDKLIEYCKIDEKGTNYPPELYNSTIWGQESMYEVLAQIQQIEMERRTKKDKNLTVERVQGTKKLQPSNPSSPSSDQKRRSKWEPTHSGPSSTTGSGVKSK